MYDDPSTMSMAKSSRRSMKSVKVLDKAVSLLSLFKPEHAEWAIADLQESLQIPRSTLYRLLHVLCHHGFLAEDTVSRKFQLGPAAVDLGRRAHQLTELRRVAVPILQQLRDASGETVLLMVVNQARTRSVCIEQIESRHGLRLIREAHADLPLYAGAASKVLLAYMGSDEIERVLSERLRSLAPRTMTTPRLVRRDLVAIRRRGYAFSREETNEGAAGIGLPILDDQGTLHAGIGVVGPAVRFHSDDRIAELVRLTRTAVAEIRIATGLAARPRRAPDNPVRHRRRRDEPRHGESASSDRPRS